MSQADHQKPHPLVVSPHRSSNDHLLNTPTAVTSAAPSTTGTVSEIPRTSPRPRLVGKSNSTSPLAAKSPAGKAQPASLSSTTTPPTLTYTHVKSELSDHYNSTPSRESTNVVTVAPPNVHLLDKKTQRNITPGLYAGGGANESSEQRARASSIRSQIYSHDQFQTDELGPPPPQAVAVSAGGQSTHEYIINVPGSASGSTVRVSYNTGQTLQSIREPSPASHEGKGTPPCYSELQAQRLTKSGGGTSGLSHLRFQHTSPSHIETLSQTSLSSHITPLGQPPLSSHLPGLSQTNSDLTLIGQRASIPYHLAPLSTAPHSSSQYETPQHLLPTEDVEVFFHHLDESKHSGSSMAVESNRQSIPGSQYAVCTESDSINYAHLANTPLNTNQPIMFYGGPSSSRPRIFTLPPPSYSENAGHSSQAAAYLPSMPSLYDTSSRQTAHTPTGSGYNNGHVHSPAPQVWGSPVTETVYTNLSGPVLDNAKYEYAVQGTVSGVSLIPTTRTESVLSRQLSRPPVLGAGGAGGGNTSAYVNPEMQTWNYIPVSDLRGMKGEFLLFLQARAVLTSAS